jgi:ABC-type phosphate/phosphonate transport system substrate-binding protein
MNLWEYRRLIAISKRKLKYNNLKTAVGEIKFDSKKEALRYQQLLHLQEAGEIKNLQCQPRYNFVYNDVKIGFYKADFRYYDLADNKWVVEDVKSVATQKLPVYRLKKKLMKAFHNIEIKEIL